MEPSLVAILLDMTFIDFMNFLVVFVFFVLLYWGTYVALPEYHEIIDNTKPEKPMIMLPTGINRFLNAFVPVGYVAFIMIILLV